MNKTFLEISNTIRKQVRRKRIAKDWSHQDLADKIDEFINYNGNGKNKYDRSRLSRFENLAENDEDAYLDSELTYYTTSILGISLDNLINSDNNDINSLIQHGAKTEEIQLIKKIFIMNYKLLNKKLSKNKFEFSKEWLKNLYNILIFSGFQSFLPPLFTIISQQSSGSTSLLNYLLDTKEIADIQGYDILYIHSDYKPYFFPSQEQDQNLVLYFDKEKFTYDKLFTLKYNTEPEENNNQIAVVFFKAEILKQITILETKDSDNSLNLNLIKDSQNIFLLSDCNNYFSVLPQMVREILDNFEDKIIKNKDFLTILLSKTDTMMKKEIEEIKTQIKENLLKEQKHLLSNNTDIIGYNITNEESMVQLMYKIIHKETLFTIYDNIIFYPDPEIPLYKEKLLAPIGLDKVYIKQEFKKEKDDDEKKLDTTDYLYNYWNGYATFINNFINYIYNEEDNSFSNCTRTEIKNFIANTLNESYLHSKEYITFKDNTNSIIINKQMLENLKNDLNKTLTDFVITKILYHDYSILRTQFLNPLKTAPLDSESNLLQDIVKQIKESPIDISSFIMDIQQSNRPTIKFFLKRFADYKNNEALRMEDFVFNYVFNILEKVINSYKKRFTIINLIEDGCSEAELKEYINLYILFRETHETIKFEINELVYPEKVLM